MSNSIVLLLALAGLAVPLSLLAVVSFFAAAHCPGLECVPLPMRATVRRAVSGAVFVGASLWGSRRPCASARRV